MLFGCTSVDRDSAGNVYAAAPTEDVIYKFSSTGTLIAKYGTHGTGAGQFDGAYGVAIRGNRHVRLRDGQQPDQRAEHDRPVPRVRSVARAPPTASSAAPRRSRSTQPGRLYVTDTGNERVEVFNVNVT